MSACMPLLSALNNLIPFITMPTQNRSPYLWPVVSAVVAALVVVIALPSEWKAWAPGFLSAPSLHLGLDLAGGTQLDFRISEEEIAQERAAVAQELQAARNRGASQEMIASLQLQLQTIDNQQENLVEAIRTVIEKRINSLGVSEATITPSYIGGERHLLVDCPGVIDVQKCINTVGKTIKLEFKEEMTEATPEFESGVRARADQIMARLTGSGEKLRTIGEDVGSELGVSFTDERPYFKDELPKGLEALWNRTPSQGPLRVEGVVTIPAQPGQEALDIPGIFIAETTGPRTATGRVIMEAPTAFAELAKQDPALKATAFEPAVLPANTDPAVSAAVRSTVPGGLTTITLANGNAGVLFVRAYVAGAEKVDVSHILVSYQGALRAEPSVTRTKEEALARAQELKKQLDGGANFEDLARAESDGPSRQAGGSLGEISRGDVAPAFESIAFTATPGLISEPVETAFGYHLIRVNKAPTRSGDSAGYDLLTVSGSGGLLKAQTLLDQLQTGKVTRTEEAVSARVLFLSLRPTGWKDTPLDGKHFRSAAVTSDPTTGVPVVQITFDDEGAKLFGDLTKKNLGKRIAIFVGGELITAPTVQTEITTGVAVITGSTDFQDARNLAQDLNTGSIPAPIYLSGQRTVEPTLGAQALQSSLYASLIGLIITAIYLIFVYRLLGVVANVALAIYALIFIALMKLPLLLISNTYVVLTLAGIAGMILSIGMSVDLNVLIFERMREELRKGKSFKTAAEIGFDRAWPSIRDSNISTLITCAILFVVGTSIVRGFAVTLALGIVVSMITGVTITRWLMRLLGQTKLAENPRLFGVKPR